MRPSENIQWLAVEGWCTPEEGDALYEQAYDGPRAFPDIDPVIVEVGTGMGRSAIAMALSGARVNTIEYDRERFAQAYLAADKCKVEHRINYINGHSCETAESWDDPVSFLFIDGWHDAENVRADYAAWAPHVVPNGAIWFHDAYGAGWPDVHALIDELVANGDLALDGYVGTIAKCRKVAT
jgi:hypothetical protein